MDLSSGQRGTVIFGGAIILVGIVMATVVFPFWNLIRDDVYEQVEILSNDGGTCYVETADDIPKTIEDCAAGPGETVTVKFGEGLAWAVIVEP